MKKIITILILVCLFGCSSKAKKTDVKNSPCACLPYFGEQLETSPTQEDLQSIKSIMAAA